MTTNHPNQVFIEQFRMILREKLNQGSAESFTFNAPSSLSFVDKNKCLLNSMCWNMFWIFQHFSILCKNIICEWRFHSNIPWEFLNSEFRLPTLIQIFCAALLVHLYKKMWQLSTCRNNSTRRSRATGPISRSHVKHLIIVADLGQFRCYFKAILLQITHTVAEVNFTCLRNRFDPCCLLEWLAATRQFLKSPVPTYLWQQERSRWTNQQIAPSSIP